MMMKRTPVNPWEWSTALGFNQAELVQGAGRSLLCSGQTSVDANGAPQHVDDMRQQMALAFDNLHAVLLAANMSAKNIVRLVVYSTDVDASMQHFDVVQQKLQGAERPAMTVVGVTRLAIPGLMFEVEATAMD